MKIILGTMNPSKTEELRGYFSGMPEVEPVSPAQMGLRNIEIEESAGSVRGNALLKARIWCRTGHLPAIAEDSGLIFPDLPEDHPDQPGMFVRRFHGQNLSDDEMLKNYIELAERHGGQLRACWQNCWWLLQDENHGICYENHSVVFLLLSHPSPLRHTGWPLDSISYLPGAGKYLVEAEDHGILEDRHDEPGIEAWVRQHVSDLLHGSLPVL